MYNTGTPFRLNAIPFKQTKVTNTAHCNANLRMIELIESLLYFY